MEPLNLVETAMLDQKSAAKRIGISRQAFGNWLKSKDLRRLLRPKTYHLSKGPVFEFREDIMDIWAKHIPPKNPGGGKRLSKEIVQAIEEEVTRYESGL